MSDDLLLDLTNYKDRVGERVVPGRYTVVVEDAESDTAKSGNPMVNLWLRVQGGEFDGSTIIDRLVNTEKSLFRVVGFMQAVGLPTPRKRFKIPVRTFVGRTLDIDVEDGDPYQGRVKSEVRGYMRISGANRPAEEAADLSDMEESLVVLTGATDPSASPLSAETPGDQKATESDEIDLDKIDL